MIHKLFNGKIIIEDDSDGIYIDVNKTQQLKEKQQFEYEFVFSFERTNLTALKGQ